MSSNPYASAFGNEQNSPMRFQVVLPADVSAISPVVSWVMRLVGELLQGRGQGLRGDVEARGVGHGHRRDGEQDSCHGNQSTASHDDC